MVDQDSNVVERAGRSVALVLSMAGIAGFALVALARTGLNWFYANFELTPEEVGLDQRTILFRTAATGTIVLAVAVGLGLGIVLGGHLIIRVSTRRPLRGAIDELVNRDRRTIIAVTSVILGLLLAYYIWGVVTAVGSVDRIRAGMSTEPQVIARGEVSAWCVLVWWPSGYLDEVFAADPGSSFVYLGQADQVGAFYDPRSQRTLRVPLSEIATGSC